MCVHYEQQAACESFYVILIYVWLVKICVCVFCILCRTMAYAVFLLCRVGFGLLAHSLLASRMIAVSVKTELLSVYGVMRSLFKISYRLCN